MKTFSPTISYAGLRSSSSGYAYDSIVIRDLGLYKLTLSVGIEFNNDNLDTDIIGSVYIYNPSNPQPVIALNANANTGTAGESNPFNPVVSCEFVLEPGNYEIHYGFRKTNASYVGQLSLLLEKLL